MSHFSAGRPFTFCYNTHRVRPIITHLARRDGAAKVDIGLVKAATRIVEFIDEADLPYGNGQSGFFHDFTCQVFGQTAVRFSAAARGTP